MEPRIDGIYLGGVSVACLADEIGTPIFVIDEAAVRARYQEIVSAFPHRPFQVYYACKANGNVALMRVLREEGAALDACSPGDVYLGLAAGFQPSEMLYTGYAVTDDELRMIVERGLRLNVDSSGQLERYAQLGGRGGIGLRLNTGVQAGYHSHVTTGGPTSKFGVRPEDVAALRDRASSLGLMITGLHTHLGSGILRVEPFLDALDVLLDAAVRCPEVTYVDLGGGLGAWYGPLDTPLSTMALGTRLSERLAAWERTHGRSLSLYLEPGEYLVADAISYVVRVHDVKRALGTPTIVGTDGSINHVIAVGIYDAYRPLAVTDRPYGRTAELVTVCGNLMQEGDVLARDRPCPRIEVGDVLLLRLCGAYSMARASQFNARPLPAEVLVAGGQARLVRRHGRLEDLLLNQEF
jgi:diaminopimelate decarboxylase